MITKIVSDTDEYYTQKEDAEIIVRQLKDKHLNVWLPFNDSNSVWGGVLTEHGHKVAITDSDFFETEPPEGTDCIISNPPFSRKLDVLKRIKEYNLKYALILPFIWLNDGVPFDYGRQLMFFRQRMYFTMENGEKNKPRCNCFVLSNGLLKADTIIYDKRGETISVK